MQSKEFGTTWGPYIINTECMGGLDNGYPAGFLCQLENDKSSNVEI